MIPFSLLPPQFCNDCQKRFPIEQLTVVTAKDRGRDVFAGFRCGCTK